MFHVSLLETAHPNTILGRSKEEPPPIVLEDGDIQYKVESLLDSKYSRRRLYYLVRWEGSSIDKDSWVPAKDISEDLKDDFHRHYPSHPGGPEAGAIGKPRRRQGQRRSRARPGAQPVQEPPPVPKVLPRTMRGRTRKPSRKVLEEWNST